MRLAREGNQMLDVGWDGNPWLKPVVEQGRKCQLDSLFCRIEPFDFDLRFTMFDVRSGERRGELVRANQTSNIKHHKIINHHIFP